LLERFYDVNEGKISFDGIDLKELDPQWLRGQAIGYINQVKAAFY
jgi:ATP-binding cassette subfamily B (MDR/TAP) protein 8